MSKAKRKTPSARVRNRRRRRRSARGDPRRISRKRIRNAVRAAHRRKRDDTHVYIYDEPYWEGLPHEDS